MHRRLSSLISLLWLAAIGLAQAQVVSDGTLSTQVSPGDGGNYTITGEDRVGDNVFYSFDQFSIPDGGSASFNNPPDVANIISRVTGGSRSDINGMIKAEGGADFFLINPSGIVFGPNASLDIGGSFIVSTADAIQFADGSSFSATNLQAQPQLSVSVPIGLQFGAFPQAIINRSQPLPGLQVEPGNTLALISSNLVMEGGFLTALEGRVELGSVASSSLVNLILVSEGWALGYETVQSFQDIQLSQSLINVTALGNNLRGSGTIQLQGRNIFIIDDSVLIGLNFGSQLGGDIGVNASGMTKLLDGGTILTDTFSNQPAGNIIIRGEQVSISDNSSVSAATSGAGMGGSITIEASKFVELSNNSRLAASALDSGMAGEITILTSDLYLRNRGRIFADSLGNGNPGSLRVNATDLVMIDGQDNPKRTGLFTEIRGIADREASGEEGSITVNTSQLTVHNGGEISTSTFSEGDGGQLTVNADSIELSGTTVNGNPSGLFSTTAGAGDAGDITVITNDLTVAGGATISTESSVEGGGDAGTVTINANTLSLNDRGALSSTSLSGSGGDIALTIGDLLLLQNQSQISTRAGIEGTGGDGGNISINAPNGFLVAGLDENNDITANAFLGDGGNISITAVGIVNLEERPSQPDNTTNDIDASSEFGQSGTVTINEIAPEPTNTELPEVVLDIRNQVDQRCSADAGYYDNSFTVTGRGGIPPSPQEIVTGESGALVDLRIPESSDSTQPRRSAAIEELVNLATVPPEQREPIVEAQTWYRNSTGAVVLTAQTPQSSPSIGASSLSCSP